MAKLKPLSKMLGDVSKDDVIGLFNNRRIVGVGIVTLSFGGAEDDAGHVELKRSQETYDANMPTIRAFPNRGNFYCPDSDHNTPKSHPFDSYYVFQRGKLFSG